MLNYKFKTYCAYDINCTIDLLYINIFVIYLFNSDFNLIISILVVDFYLFLQQIMNVSTLYKKSLNHLILNCDSTFIYQVRRGPKNLNLIMTECKISNDHDLTEINRLIGLKYVIKSFKRISLNMIIF